MNYFKSYLKNLSFVSLLGLAIFGLIGTPRATKVSTSSANDIFRTISIETEIKSLYQQVKDFSRIDSQQMTGKLKYEPTGEVFNSPEEVKRALPERKARLAKLLMAYHDY